MLNSFCLRVRFKTKQSSLPEIVVSTELTIMTEIVVCAFYQSALPGSNICT